MGLTTIPTTHPPTFTSTRKLRASPTPPTPTLPLNRASLKSVQHCATAVQKGNSRLTECKASDRGRHDDFHHTSQPVVVYSSPSFSFSLLFFFRLLSSSFFFRSFPLPLLAHQRHPTHQHINTPTHQHINTPTHQHSNTPTHQHTNTSTH